MTSSTPGSPNRLWQVRTPEKREYLVAFSDLRTVPEGSMVRLGGLIEWTSVDNAILEGAKHEGQSAMPTSATFSTPQHIESDLLLTIDSQYASLQEKKNALALLKDKRALAPLIEKARAKRVRNY
ncbi:MAG TPA: hypothetical protein VHO25_02025 [Polyangiaceae bacterium]|nr:hypothetical protein [Polyangiaceae bacterium]